MTSTVDWDRADTVTHRVVHIPIRALTAVLRGVEVDVADITVFPVPHVTTCAVAPSMRVPGDIVRVVTAVVGHRACEVAVREGVSSCDTRRTVIRRIVVPFAL